MKTYYIPEDLERDVRNIKRNNPKKFVSFDEAIGIYNLLGKFGIVFLAAILSSPANTYNKNDLIQSAIGKNKAEIDSVLIGNQIKEDVNLTPIQKVIPHYMMKTPLNPQKDLLEWKNNKNKIYKI